MSTVEHSVPAAINLAWDLEIGRWQESFVSELEDGSAVERTYWERAKRTYSGDFSDWKMGTTFNENLRSWDRFLTHVRNKRSSFYLTEAVAESHDNILLGYGNGTRTVFPYPVVGGAIATQTNMVMVDGKSDATATVYVANALPEICADCSSAAAAYVTAIGGATFSLAEWESRDGLYSLYCNPGTLPYGHEIPVAQRPAAAAGQVWTATASVKGNGTFLLEIVFYTGGGVAIAPVASTSQAADWTRWYDVSKTDTAPATTATVGVRLTRTAGGAENWLVGAQGLARGDVARWWLPSAGMYNVILASAPSAGAIVTTSFLGQRIVRCRMNNSKLNARREARGDALVPFEAVEEWEV